MRKWETPFNRKHLAYDYPTNITSFLLRTALLPSFCSSQCSCLFTSWFSFTMFLQLYPFWYEPSSIHSLSLLLLFFTFLPWLSAFSVGTLHVFELMPAVNQCPASHQVMPIFILLHSTRRYVLVSLVVE